MNFSSWQRRLYRVTYAGWRFGTHEHRSRAGQAIFEFDSWRLGKSEVSFIGDIMGPSRWRTFQLVVYSPMLVMMIGVATWRFGWLACAAALLFFAWMF